MGYCIFAATFGRCTTRQSRKVAVQVMMERANCFGALSSRCFLVAIKFFSSFYRRMPMQICCPLRDEIEVRS